MKKTLAILLALLMVFASFTAVFAADYDYDLVFISEPDNGCEKVLRKEIYREGVLSYAEILEYSEDGFCISQTTQRPDENGGFYVEDITRFEYDSEGRISKWEYFIPSTEDPLPDTGIAGKLEQSGIFTYGENWDEEEITLYENSGSKVVSRTRHEYNADGERIHTIEYHLDDTEKMYLSYESTTTEENKVITRIDQSFGSYPYFHKYVSEYTDNRNYPTKEYVYSSYDGTEPVLSDCYEYEYDDQQRTVREHFVHYEDGTETICTTTYEIGGNGEHIMTVKTTDMQGGYISEESYIDTYDAFGNQIGEVVRIKESETAEWETGLDERYTFNSNGTLASDLMKLTVSGEIVSTELRYVSELKHRKLQKIEEQAPGFGKAGVKEYYYCDACEHYYSDADGQKPIANIEAWKTGEGAIEAKPVLPIVAACAAVVIVAAVLIMASKKKKN